MSSWGRGSGRMLGDPGPWRPRGRIRRWLWRARIRVGDWLGLEP